MKKRILAVVLVIALSVVAMPIGLGAANEADRTVTVKIDGEVINFSDAPVIVNGRTLVPFRELFDILGFGFWYGQRAISVTALSGADFTIRLPIQEYAELADGATYPAIVNGRPIELDVPAMRVVGRAFAPLRFVAETVGYSVDWCEDTWTVEIIPIIPEALAPPNPFIIEVVEIPEDRENILISTRHNHALGGFNSSFQLAEAFTGIVTVEFDLTFGPEVDATSDATVVIAQHGRIGGTYQNMPILIQFARGSINVRHGPIYVNSTVPVAANLEYSFRIVIDLDAGTYNVYVVSVTRITENPWPNFFPEWVPPSVVYSEEIHLEPRDADFRTGADPFPNVGSILLTHEGPVEEGLFWIENIRVNGILQ